MLDSLEAYDYIVARLRKLLPIVYQRDRTRIFGDRRSLRIRVCDNPLMEPDETVIDCHARPMSIDQIEQMIGNALMRVKTSPLLSVPYKMHGEVEAERRLRIAAQKAEADAAILVVEAQVREQEALARVAALESRIVEMRDTIAVHVRDAADMTKMLSLRNQRITKLEKARPVSVAAPRVDSTLMAKMTAILDKNAATKKRLQHIA